MADNTQLNTGTGGDVVRDKDRAGVKTQVVGLDINPAGSEVLGTGDATNGLDVDVTRVQGTVTVSGAVTLSAAIPAGTNNIGDVDVLTTPTGAADNGVLPAVVDVVGGYDGSNVQVVKTDVNGIVQTAVNGTAAVSAASLPLPAGASTAAKQPALGTAGAASADVLTVQGVASMTALKTDGSGVTQPVSGTVSITANSSVNQAQVAGTTVDTNSGVKSAGTQRVVLATDQPQLTNALKVDGSAVTQPVSIAAAVPVTDNSGSLTVDAPVGTPVFATITPSTTGGWSKIKYAAQTTTVQTVKGSAGTFGGYYVYNPNATVAYVQVFDVSGTVTLGTTVPDMIFGIPATSAANLEIANGVNMTNAVKLACTTTATGSTAPGTGLDLSVFYK
jgi:hypothetical protein